MVIVTFEACCKSFIFWCLGEMGKLTIWAFGIIGHLLPDKWIHDSSKGSRNQDVAGPFLTPLEESPSGMMEN